MPDERAINKVIYGGNTLMDITDTTATESDVVSGEIFYLANGTRGVGTANYISTETDPTVPSWAKETNPPSYTLSYNENKTVGRAKVGTAKTGTPNYTPSGDIVVTTKTVDILTGATLYGYEGAGYLLNIGVELTTTPTEIIDEVTFNGNGVHFTIERDT